MTDLKRQRTGASVFSFIWQPRACRAAGGNLMPGLCFVPAFTVQASHRVLTGSPATTGSGAPSGSGNSHSTLRPLSGQLTPGD